MDRLQSSMVEVVLLAGPLRHLFSQELIDHIMHAVHPTSRTASSSSTHKSRSEYTGVIGRYGPERV